MSAFESVVEESAVQILQEMGYAYLPGAELEDERGRITEVMLEGRLRQALARINPHLPHDALDEAARRLLQPPTASVEENNRLFHKALTRGLTLEVRRDGEVRGDLAWPVDFDDPDANDWLVTNQLTVRGPENLRRPDLVVYLNGLPVAVLELKNPVEAKATLFQAWKKLQDYKEQIPSLFDTNEMLVVSDGSEARVGSLTAGYEWFGPWKSIEGKTPEPGTRSTQERLLRGLFDRDRFLRYLRHYVFWETDGARVKKIAQYHQFYAVEKAVAATVDRYQDPEGDRRVGVIWHTQGSGKSVSMLFYAGQVIREPRLENPTLVVLTDRLDLDDQLFTQFAAAKDLLPSPTQADDREHLRDLLRVASGGVVFTTLQKFSTPSGERMPQLTDRRNVIVLADEAHRSHYEFAEGLARNLHDALPHAMFLGFTGTPIELEDRSTPGVFGDYLDVYPMSQSVADEATVPILYESRQHQSYLLDRLLDQVDERVHEVAEDLPETTRERLLREEASLSQVLGNPKMIQGVAEDIVEHWEGRQATLRGKGLIATPSRDIAVMLYDRIAALRPAWHSESDDEGRIKVVMSDYLNAPPMHQPHLRDRRGLKAIEKRFKDPDDPLELVLVVDMWLTGFDVPPAHTLYLYKELKGHNLMQAIARVNRVWGDKPGGLIVDYLGIAQDLKKAVGRYGGYPGARVAVPIEEALEMLEEKVGIVRDMFHGFDQKPFFSGSDQERMRTLTAAQDHILSLDQANGQSGMERFSEAMTALNKAVGLALHREEARKWRDEVAFYQAVYRALRKNTEPREAGPRDLRGYREAIRRIVAGSIASEGVVDVFEAAGLSKPEVSILSNEFLEAVRLRQEYPSLQVEMLRRLLEEEIRSQKKRNVVQGRKFSEMLEQTMNRYRNRALQAAQVVQELIDLAQQMREVPNRAEELGLTDDELAFYDALADHGDVREVMGDDTLSEIAHDLVDSIRRSVTIDWTQKEAVRARMRATIKRLLRRHGYPPDQQEAAVETVIEQAQSLCRDWAERNGKKGEEKPAPRIVRDENGVPVIAGANTKVVELVRYVRAYEETPEEIHQELPHLSVEQIQAALAFYEEHRDEIDQDIRDRLAKVERFRKKMGAGPGAEKLRELLGR